MTQNFSFVKRGTDLLEGIILMVGKWPQTSGPYGFWKEGPHFGDFWDCIGEPILPQLVPLVPTFAVSDTLGNTFSRDCLSAHSFKV